jgi:hypothetical protein
MEYISFQARVSCLGNYYYPRHASQLTMLDDGTLDFLEMVVIVNISVFFGYHHTQLVLE